jgi:hypothetical protein
MPALHWKRKPSRERLMAFLASIQLLFIPRLLFSLSLLEAAPFRPHLSLAFRKPFS